MKLGIIRCDSYSNNCPAAGCLRATRQLTGSFARYDDVELVGLDTCGRCDRGQADKVTERAQRLRKQGAEAVHLGNCMIGPCPHQDTFHQAIEKQGMKVIKGTH